MKKKRIFEISILDVSLSWFSFLVANMHQIFHKTTT